MLDFKEEIAQALQKATGLEKEELKNYIEVPKDASMGDYAFPCFKLAKTLKKAPPMIATEINEKLEVNENVITKVEIVGGYINFYVNNNTFINEVLKEYDAKKEQYGNSNMGEGKNIVIEYSSPNIAKPFHIGHLRSTVIGGALYKIYKFLGYNTIGINHLGDYGTQFGKIIEGYKRWGEEYQVEENPIDELTKIYIRINKLCEEDEEVLNLCRDNFKKLEEGDEYCTKIWQKLRDLSLKEIMRNEVMTNEMTLGMAKPSILIKWMK